MSGDERMSRIFGISYPNLPGSLLWLSATLVVTLLLSPPPSVSHLTPDKESELQKIFQIRNEDEWKSAWHLEKHTRCRDQLLNHMEWACVKDVYRLDKKFSTGLDEVESPYLTSYTAKSVIKPWTGYIRKKRENKSITEECCSASGCTWEEYAEYCPAHRRYRVSRSRS